MTDYIELSIILGSAMRGLFSMLSQFKSPKSCMLFGKFTILLCDKFNRESLVNLAISVEIVFRLLCDKSRLSKLVRLKK